MYIVYVRPDVGSVTPEVRDEIYVPKTYGRPKLLLI